MLLAILLSAAPTIGTLPPGVVPLRPLCQNPGTILADDANRPLVQPLGDQPPAQHILAVLRTDFDGCVKPVVASAKGAIPHR